MQDLGNSESFIEIKILIQESDIDVFPEDNLSFIRNLNSFQDLEKRCFTGTIFSNQRHFFAMVNTKTYIFKKSLRAIRLRKTIYREQIHGGKGTCLIAAFKNIKP